MLRLGTIGRIIAGAGLLAAAGAAAVLFLRYPSQNGNPIRIGVLHALTGTMAVSEKPLADAVELAIEEINASGGILGRKVEAVVADTRSDWDLSAAEAERLIRDAHVSAIFGCWTSACRKAVKPVVERYRHLLFYPVQYEGLEQSPYIVYTGSAPNQQIIPGTRWALDTLGRKIYLLGSDYVFPRTANRIIGDLVKASGGTVLAERYRPLGDSDFAAEVEEIRRLKPDVVLNTINGDSNLYFFRALDAAGLDTLPVVSFSVAEGELRGMGGIRHKSHYAVWSYFQSLPGDSNERFIAAYRHRFGDDRVTSDPIEAAYAGVLLWAEAVREAGTDQPDQVNRSILRQSIAAPSGILTVDSATRHLWKRMLAGKARADGNFDIVFSSDGPIRPAPFPPYRSREEWLKIASTTGAAPPAAPVEAKPGVKTEAKP